MHTLQRIVCYNSFFLIASKDLPRPLMPPIGRLSRGRRISRFYTGVTKEGLAGGDDPCEGGEVYARMAQRFALGDDPRAHWALFQGDEAVLKVTDALCADSKLQKS
jgi:hypothetical protein